MKKTSLPAALAALALLATLMTAGAADYPPPYPREGAVKVLDNELVLVWNATWTRGVPTPLHEHRMDQLSVTVIEGSVKVTPLGGKAAVGDPATPGTIRFLRAGTVHEEEGTSERSRRAFMVEFKPQTGAAAVSAVTPAAFAPGTATRGLDNDRVQVWDVTVPQGGQLPSQLACCAALVVSLDSAPAANGGSIAYVPAGTALPALQTGAAAQRAVIVLLK